MKIRLNRKEWDLSLKDEIQNTTASFLQFPVYNGQRSKTNSISIRGSVFIVCLILVVVPTNPDSFARLKLCHSEFAAAKDFSN